MNKDLFHSTTPVVYLHNTQRKNGLSICHLPLVKCLLNIWSFVASQKNLSFGSMLYTARENASISPLKIKLSTKKLASWFSSVSLSRNPRWSSSVKSRIFQYHETFYTCYSLELSRSKECPTTQCRQCFNVFEGNRIFPKIFLACFLLGLNKIYVMPVSTIHPFEWKILKTRWEI